MGDTQQIEREVEHLRVVITRLGSVQPEGKRESSNNVLLHTLDLLVPLSKDITILFFDGDVYPRATQYAHYLHVRE